MRFTGGIADQENAVRPAAPDSGANGAGREPAVVQHGAGQRLTRGAAIFCDVREHGVSSRGRASRIARALKLVAADATGQTQASAIAMNHTTVSAGKSQERHKANRQPAIQESRLEPEQVGRARSRARRLSRQGAVFPRTASGDYDPGPQFGGLRILPADRFADVAASFGTQ